MPNPFSPTTTGGRAGQTVYDDLSSKQKYDNATIALSRAARYESEDQQKVNNYVVVLKALDEDALSKLQTINSKKQEIVTIINNVYNTFNPTTQPLVSSKASVNDPVAEKVVYMAGISTFNYNCGGLPLTCSLGVRGDVFPDVYVAWQYPNLENLDANQVFYKDNGSYVKITNANLGIGATAYEFGDAAGATGTVGLVTTSNSSLGYYYFWPNLSSVNAGAATSISNIVDEIEALRNQISDALNDTQNGTNKVRDLKTQSQIDLWFEKKGQRSVNVTDYQGGLSSLETNSSIVQNYNA